MKDGKPIAVITGAAQGIGRRTAEILADPIESPFINGHTLVVDGGWTADVSWDSLASTTAKPFGVRQLSCRFSQAAHLPKPVPATNLPLVTPKLRPAPSTAIH